MPGQNLRGFAEKVALVTGGSSRIGRAVALQLALEGAYVIVQNEAESEADDHLISELRSLGTLVSAIKGTVATAAGVTDIFSEVEPIFGRLDMLVNAAGNESLSNALGDEEERWNQTLRLMCRGAYLCSVAARKLMSGRPSPAIVNVAVWDEPADKQTLAVRLAASRSIEGVTEALALELEGRIRVNCVTMNAKDTGHSVAADDAARACVYLLSGEAKAVRGQMVRVG